MTIVSFFVPLPSRAISHMRGHLRVSCFAQQTTEKERLFVVYHSHDNNNDNHDNDDNNSDEDNDNEFNDITCYWSIIMYNLQNWNI